MFVRLSSRARLQSWMFFIFLVAVGVDVSDDSDVDNNNADDEVDAVSPLLPPLPLPLLLLLHAVVVVMVVLLLLLLLLLPLVVVVVVSSDGPSSALSPPRAFKGSTTFFLLDEGAEEVLELLSISWQNERKRISTVGVLNGRRDVADEQPQSRRVEDFKVAS